MHRIPAAALCAVLLPSALVLAACASSSKTITSGNTSSPSSSTAPSSTPPAAPSSGNNAGLTSAQLTAAINAALPTVNALLVKGTITSNGTSISLDVQFDKDSAAGTVGEGATHIIFISSGGATYVKITSSLLAAAGPNIPPAVAKLLLNKWVSSKTTLGGSIAGGIAPFSDITAFTQQLAQNKDDVFTAQGTTTMNGAEVAKYKDVNPTDGTTELYLPATGLSLPIEEVGTGKNVGAVTFLWNKPTTISPPSAADIYSGPGVS